MLRADDGGLMVALHHRIATHGHDGRTTPAFRWVFEHGILRNAAAVPRGGGAADLSARRLGQRWGIMRLARQLDQRDARRQCFPRCLALAAVRDPMGHQNRLWPHTVCVVTLRRWRV